MLSVRPISSSNRELWWAFIAIILITLVYLFTVVTWSGIPAASGLFGHSIGILGFLLMLMTETLYSYRKRSRTARWGRLSSWLRFHIFTGLVGPYMVLLHSSWKFNGLAGITMLLTIIIVVSGFLGRYIYTSIPRTADGMEVEAGEVEQYLTALQADLQNRKITQSQNKEQAREYKLLLKRQRILQRQFASLALARRMMALWHTIHVPIGMALFSAAFIHSIAAIYYATLLR